jgi:protein gp37
MFRASINFPEPAIESLPKELGQIDLSGISWLIVGGEIGLGAVHGKDDRL